MAAASDLKRYREQLTPVAVALFATASEETSTDEWVSVVLDLRYPESGNEYMHRIDLELPESGSQSLRGTGQLSDALCDLDSAREGFPDRWFGVRVHVTAEGQCGIFFNYNPECSGEPDWLA